MKKLAILMCLAFLSVSITAEAKGRKGSHRVGGYTKQGKGSHYVGGRH